MDLQENVLLPLIHDPDVVDLDGQVSEGEALEEDPLDEARRLVLVHDGLHRLLDGLPYGLVIILPHLPHHHVGPLQGTTINATGGADQ